MNFCVRAHVLVCLLLCARLVSAQSTTIRPEAGRSGPGSSQSRQREQWFRHGRMLPGHSAAALRYRAQHQKLQLRGLHAAATHTAGLPRVASGTVWTPLGPAPLASDATGLGVQDYGPVAGRATAVAVDPADGSGNTVYIGGAYGGVWKSTNAGALSPNPSSVTWTPLTDDQPTLAVGSIAIQPQLTKPGCQQEPGPGRHGREQRFRRLLLRIGHSAFHQRRRHLDPDFPGQYGHTTLLPAWASARSHSAPSTPAWWWRPPRERPRESIEGLEDPVMANRGLYYSNDSGASWNYATMKDAGLTIDPSSATSVVYNATSRQFFAAIQWHGIYSSTDGATWDRLNSQPGGLSPVSCPATPTTSTCLLYRGEFAVVPGRNEMYFWYVDGNNGDRLIWQTKNGGSSWTQINDDGITNCGDVLGGCGTEQGSYNLELAAVPDGQVTDLYAGAVNLYKCRITTASPSCNGSAPRHLHQSHPRLRMSAQLRLDRACPSLPARHILSANQRQHPGGDVFCQRWRNLPRSGRLHRTSHRHLRRQQPVRQSEPEAGLDHPVHFLFTASY